MLRARAIALPAPRRAPLEVTMHHRTPSRRGVTGVGLLLALSTGFGLGAYGFSEVSGLGQELSFSDVSGLGTEVQYSNGAGSAGAGLALGEGGSVVLYQPEEVCLKTGCTTTWTSFTVDIEGVNAGYSMSDEVGAGSVVLYQDGDDLILRVGDATGVDAAGLDAYVHCFDADTSSRPAYDLSAIDAGDGVTHRVGVSKQARNGASALLPYDYKQRITLTGQPARGPASGEAVCVAVEDGAVVGALGLGFFDEADALFGKRTSFQAQGWIY